MIRGCTVFAFCFIHEKSCSIRPGTSSGGGVRRIVLHNGKQSVNVFGAARVGSTLRKQLVESLSDPFQHELDENRGAALCVADGDSVIICVLKSLYAALDRNILKNLVPIG